MKMRALPSTTVRCALVVAAAAAIVSSSTQSAQARDFFSSFFNTLMGRPQPASQPALGYNGDMQLTPQAGPQAPTSYAGRGTAYCVRTCDGRYFPISANNEQSRAATCGNLCPASETKVFYGSSIDHATTETGKSYSSLANAFKYREQLVQGCTCNGRDSVGLASISIDEDKTIRKGDIVAGANGLIVASRPADRRGGIAQYTPAPRSIREKFERSHAMARN